MIRASVRLARRVGTFIGSRPEATRFVIVSSLGDDLQGEPSNDTERYWLLLPQWLGRLLQPRRRRAVNEILWGQYCLFAFVSMQDEVLDSQTSSPDVMFAAYEFLAEAERVFARQVSDKRFWGYYRESLARTARGILTANAIQRGGPGPIEPLLSSYAAQSGIFKLGSAAICLPCGARAVFQRVSRFADHLAIAGQLLDDLEDLREDLADGRLNAAGRLLVPDAGARSPDIDRRVAEALFAGESVAALLGRIRRHVRDASSALEPLAFPGARRYVSAIRADLVEAEAALHRARVAGVFGPILGTRDSPADDAVLHQVPS